MKKIILLFILTVNIAISQNIGNTSFTFKNDQILWEKEFQVEKGYLPNLTKKLKQQHITNNLETDSQINFAVSNPFYVSLKLKFITPGYAYKPIKGYITLELFENHYKVTLSDIMYNSLSNDIYFNYLSQDALKEGEFNTANNSLQWFELFNKLLLQQFSI